MRTFSILRPLAVLVLATTFGRAADRDIQFNRDIRPILSDNCFACHGPDKEARKGKVRLDTAEGAYATRDGTAAIVPRHPEKSETVARIESADPEDIMPPPKSGKQLTTEQRRLLKDWIALGARYEGHWAYQKPLRAQVPSTPQPGVENLQPIDSFISHRLAREGLALSPEADRRTLIRRVSLDLTGLPPTPEHVRSFVNDRDPAAYEKLVDELLRSAHYGERMAVHWLDLVRYADTIGYHGDVPVSVWPYRDYVIDAFNQNLPFDRFTREQLAGDLLPDATERQKVASTFNRLNRMSTEGGIQDKEYLAKYAADRVRTVATTWLGSTMGCAECHDHKFDPFSTKDFYSMAAFFADLTEQGFYDRGFSEGNWGPKLLLPSPVQKARLEKIDAEIAALRKQMEAIPDGSLDRGRTNWEATVLALDKNSNTVWKTQTPRSASTANGATLTNGSDNIVWASGKNPDNETYTITFQPGAGEWRGLRLQTYIDEQYAGNRVARGGTSFILTEAEVFAGGAAFPRRKVKLAHVVASTQAEGFPAVAMLDGRSETGWGIPIGHSKEHQAAFHFAAPLVTRSNTLVTVRLRHDHYERKATIGKFRLGLTSVGNPLPTAPLPDEVLKALRVAPEKRDEKQSKTIVAHYRSLAPNTAKLARQIARLQGERSLAAAEVPSTLVSLAREKSRTMRVLPRGDWMNDSGEIVLPAAPRFLSAAPQMSERSTRLDLAEWFISKDNPLTARAFVNRLWKMYFGTGLSRTLDDLGTQGEWPTHPELFDWLACEFMDSGWDVKHLVRLIATSRTYRQSSSSTSELDQKDPQNRLLARQSRLRLDAELVRDTALSVSQLLVPEIGGPSVRPYQPEGYYASLNFPKREYTPDKGDRLYRRTLYTHLQRTFPHPLLVNFDAPGREECVALRIASNTPSQALNLLNDPIFVEAARVFAANIVKQGGRGFEARLRWAYQRALARDPTAEETEVLRGLFDRQLARYRADEPAARELLRVGETPVPKGDAATRAAWTGVARVILNLNEIVTRN